MRQVERFEVSPIEQELAFGEWCKKNGIRMVLMDGDDTLWQTAVIFDAQMKRCSEFLAKSGIFTSEQWDMEIRRVNNILFETLGVNPRKMMSIVEELGQQYGLSGGVQTGAEQILAEIYHIPPKFIAGTEEGLAFLRKVRMSMGIVTHANREWTWRKFGWLNLGRFVDWDDIYIIDENGHKTSESWKGAMRYFRIEPEACLVIGDSPRTDINPVNGLGVRHSFLVKAQSQSWVWTIHQQPMDDEKTRIITSVNDLRGLGRGVVFRERR